LIGANLLFQKKENRKAQVVTAVTIQMSRPFYYAMEPT
jgi:hypothetical protein